MKDKIEEINEAFKSYGKSNTWSHRSFRKLLRLRELESFQISDYKWFKGADHILKLVDELHTEMTPTERFREVATLMSIDTEHLSMKQDIASKVKEHTSWPIYFNKVNRQSRTSAMFKMWDQMFSRLRRYGLEPVCLPERRGKGKWGVWVKGSGDLPEGEHMLQVVEELISGSIYFGAVIDGHMRVLQKNEVNSLKGTGLS